MIISAHIALIHSMAASNQLTGVMNRTYEVVASVSAIVVGLLWIPIAISFFSGDEDRRFDAKVRMKNALIGTFIYILALSGTLYAVLKFVVSG